VKCKICGKEAGDSLYCSDGCAVDAQTGSESNKKYIYNKTHMNKLLWLRDMRAETRR
jgi:hypothetical protein